MKPSRKSIALVVAGVTVVGVTTIGAVLTHETAWATADGTTPPSAQSGYCADMADAIGLYTGNPVTQMGFRIGTITEITPTGQSARVSFELDGGRSIPASVKAVTRSKSLLADRSLELVENYTAGPTLEPGSCVATADTYTPKTISEIAGSSADFLEAITGSGDSNVQDSISGLDKAMAGTEESANSMMTRAAAAAASPEQVTADIGSSIMNMAPLTDDALRDWDKVRSILDQMPEIASEATDLFAQVAKFDRGVGWLVATLYDIQRNYGNDIWPIVHGPVTELVRAAAARTPDIAGLFEVVPAMSGALSRQTAVAGGLSVPYTAPKVSLDPAECLALGPACDAGSIDLLQLVVRSAANG